MSLDKLATRMIKKTAGIGLEAAQLLNRDNKGSTGGTKSPKSKRKAQRAARRKTGRNK